MRIVHDDKLTTISQDGNVLKFSTEDYANADLSEYNSIDISFSELRRIYNRAQRVYFSLRNEGAPLEECIAARVEYANIYKRYKELLLESLHSK